MKDIFEVKTINQIHQMLGDKKPDHPLITVVDVEKIAVFDRPGNIKYKTGFYTIALKTGGECEIKYGRKSYDFNEGSLVFSKPGQVSEVESSGSGKKPKGWILCFHPDLIRGTSLANKIHDYTYFEYNNNEALHLSQKEKDTISSIVSIIETEFSMNLDNYSNKLILSNLETLLNYCERYYGRQFITRRNVNQEGISKFELLLKKRMEEESLEKLGIPTVKEFAEDMGYSQNYLSDMLMKETGMRPLDYIHEAIIEKAKNLLLGSDSNIADIAYILGYDYPEHFSKFFKKKTGLSPLKFRSEQSRTC